VLSNGEDDRLVVGAAVDAGELVESSGESRAVGGEDVALSRLVESLEESKVEHGQDVGSVEGSELLNNNVRVADDDSALQSLGRSVVVPLRVDKVSTDQVGDLHLNVERSVGGEGSESVGGEDKLARGHLGGRRDFTDGRWVARAGHDLLTVGQGLSGTEVDEVVLAGQRSNLSCDGNILAIVGKVGNRRRIKGQ